MDSKVLQKKLENAKSLDDCKVAIEEVLERYDKLDDNSYRRDSYANFYNSIFKANISNKWKKSLIHALLKYGIKPGRWDINDYMTEMFNCQDLKMLKVILKMFGKKRFNPNPYRCDELAQDPTNNTWIIKYLTTFITTLGTKKSFLKGAIKTRNMNLIAYIVDVMKIDLFIPTHIRSQFSFGYELAKTDDLELVQWLEVRGYNIHESRRQLLNCAYSLNSKRILQYVLEKQKETAAADVYMEEIGRMAYQNNDEDMLRKYPVVDFHVSQSMIYEALEEHKDFLRIKILINRYIVIQTSRFAKRIYFSTTPENNPILFEEYHLNRFAKLANYGGVWSYISNMLYKYGSTNTQIRLQSMGYVVGAENQKSPVISLGRKPRNNHDDDDDDLEEELYKKYK